MSPLRIATNANQFVLSYNNPVASKSKEREGILIQPARHTVLDT